MIVVEMRTSASPLDELLHDFLQFVLVHLAVADDACAPSGTSFAIVSRTFSMDVRRGCGGNRPGPGARARD